MTSADVGPRDRENTTILVTGLKRGIESERVTTFFETVSSRKKVVLVVI